MPATAITCPRCKGDGEIKVRMAPGEDPKEGPCPVFRGTGLASLLEPMGAPPARRAA